MAERGLFRPLWSEHVLAVGIRANCEVLVTFNLRDVPTESDSAFDIEIVHPAEFLLG